MFSLFLEKQKDKDTERQRCKQRQTDKQTDRCIERDWVSGPAFPTVELKFHTDFNSISCFHQVLELKTK